MQVRASVASSFCVPLLQVMPATPQVKIFKWGIFHIAYEVPKRSISSSVPIHSVLSAFRRSDVYEHVWRLIKDVFWIAPMTSSAYIASSVWLGISPALSLQLSYCIIQKIEDLACNEDRGRLQLMQAELTFKIFALLFSALLSVIIEKWRHEKELSLCGQLRYHFLPLIVTASVNTDMKFIQDKDVRRYYPTASSYGEGAPCWSLLKGLTERLQSVISLALEVLLLIRVLLQRDIFDRFSLGATACVFFLVLIYSPTNGVDGAGYTFWTTNTAYHQLNSLYSIAFGEKFREQLVKDGINGYISKEYSKHSQELGVIKSDLLSLACLLPIPWYYIALRHLFLEYPMVICALFLKWNSSPYIMATLVFFQSATSAIRCGIDNLRWSCDPRSLSGLSSEAKVLYHSIRQGRTSQCLTSTPYPNSSAGYAGGMAVQLRGVTYKYQDTLEGEAALRDVSLNIPANSLVLLVGENGSGKSTLLKVLARLQEPNTGDIFIDDTPITFYDLPSIRKHINFLMQSEDIYPLSIKENLLMVVPDRKNLGETAREKMDEALRLGGSEKLVERVGYDAVLNPPVLLAQSLQGCGNGPIGSAALRELEKHTQRRLISVSHGEKQRFIASRSFMRLLNSDTRLLMVDEPTSALDPIAERDIFQQFQEKSRGKTTIFVTHRFANLAKHADMIICMKNGGIIEQGRHDDLIGVGGEYARLYNAQLI